MAVETLRKDSSKPLAVEVVGRDPTSPEQGRIWFNTSAGVLKIRIGSQNKVLAYASEVWKHLGGEDVPAPKSGAVTYDIVGGLKPPDDATRNIFHFGADPPTTGMKQGDFWIKNTGEPPFEIYQYDGVTWRKSVYSDFGEMLGHATANQLNVFDWFLSDPNWQNNTPSAGYVTWDECILTFDGESHVISTGNTNKHFIWWDEDNPEVFQLSDTKPTLMAEDALLCTNEEGIAYPALTGTMIHGGRIVTHSITSDEIKAGSITTESMNVVDWFPEDLVWTDDTPSSGYVTWSGFSLIYKGVKHTITGGNTNKKYIWWDYTTPTVLQSSDGQPALDDNDCVICVNEGGAAHQILQATIIHGGAILTSSIEAAQVKAGTITADEITLVSIDSNGKLKLGEIGSGDIDDILDGTTYARVKGTALTSGEVDLGLAGVVNKTAANIAETAALKWAAETGADVTSNNTSSDTSNVSGVSATTVKNNAADGKTAYDDTVKYRSAGAPTNNPTPSGIDKEMTDNATMNIKLSWGTYTQGVKQSDILLVFWKKGTSPLGAPTVDDSCVGFNVNTANPSYFIFEGINPDDNLSFGIAAARRTESGLEIGTIQSPTSTPDWQDVTIGTPDYTAQIDGTAASTVTSNAASGATAFTGTVNYRSTGAPTNNPTTGNVTKTIHADGSMEIEIAWDAYTQGAKQADSLILFWKNGASSGLGAPTVNDSAVSFNVNTSAASYFVFESAATNRYYSFGISSARRTENGLEIGAIQSPGGWQDVTEGTANYTANISGTVAATVESNASQGATAYSGTTKYRSSGAPTNNPSPTAIDIDATPKAGNIDIKLSWGAYTQGAKQADVLLLFWKKGASSGLGAPTVNDACVAFNVNTASSSFYILEGLASEKYYSFGIASARRTESGLEIGSIQSPTSAPDWQDITSGTPDYKGNVDGETAANIHSWSEDPASRINVKATLIEPGKILISGGTDLSDWRASGDYTYIDGGRIYTGSVTTDQIKLSSLTSDPTYNLCKIWYRSDLDQLRVWGTDTGTPFKIPRIPVASSVYITPLGVIASGQTSLTTFTNRTADNISETGSKKWAGETGADVTGGHTAANASSYTGSSITTTYTAAKCTDPLADQTSTHTAANSSAYTGSTIATGYTAAKCTDPNADQTSTHTANNATNYTGNTVATAYTAAKCTDPNADQTSAHTANNANNYTGNSISTPYTAAKCTDANADQTSAHDCQHPGDYTAVTAQAHSWLTDSPSTAHHVDYAHGSATTFGGAFSLETWYGPYSQDSLITTTGSVYRSSSGPFNFQLEMQVKHDSTFETVGESVGQIDEEQATRLPFSFTGFCPTGWYWRVHKVTDSGVTSYGFLYWSRGSIKTQ